LDLDLAAYSQEFEDLLKRTHEITGDVLITSPSDFSGLNEFLEEFSN
jgi:homocysteine S-methyltransferase